MRLHDTIVAPATPPTPAPRAIVRTSGPAAFELLASVSDGERPPHASATERFVRLADAIAAPTTIYAFVGPRSSTGEDVVEYHLPGSPLFVRMLLARLLSLGARSAEPGEFTARAFFAGRLDLARAEGVAATIAAGNRRELDASRQLLAGELSRRLSPIVDAVADTLALVEADLDFADEPVDVLAGDEVAARIDGADASLSSLLASAARIERLSHEPRIVLTGRPNAGKSTLLNALAGDARAVVSDMAGTTRDALSARVRLRRGTVVLVDTAGLDGGAVDAPIARQMRDVALNERERADVVLGVVALDDLADSVPAADEVVWTKADLVPAQPGTLTVSAKAGAGLDALRERLDALAFGDRGDDEGRRTLALNARHVEAVAQARDALEDARAARPAGPEFVAAALRRALDALGSVGGAVTPDAVLGRIFGSFCIGK